ncbi:restriction endonuclease [Deinococcus lacus]|uniref:Restriction endonuclease n=1 Tax=Deinococcus lacus TaxID=392561 RepID=A0ABW1YGD2_9DEIO
MRETMPNFDEFNALTLKFMGDGVARHVSQIKDEVMQLANLSPEVLAETQPSGELRVRDRIAWACSNLFLAGLLDRPSRAVYQISETGKQLLPEVGEQLGEKEFAPLPKWQKYLAERSQKQKGKGVGKAAPTLPDERETENTVLEIVQRLNRGLADDLLQRLREGSPEFFERAVIRVLRGMGYGGTGEGSNVEALRRESHTGRSGDGGIDGIIKLDALGVQNIYIQAKRYKQGNTIGRPELQGFVGALHGKRVARGVFITTSHYTAEAKAYAEGEAQDRLVLIDGVQLANLMLSYGVGVQPKQTLTLLEIDEDFFE